MKPSEILRTPLYFFSTGRVEIPISNSIHSDLEEISLTLARAGMGGWGLMQDLPQSLFFLKLAPNRGADGAEILHSLWGIHCATFGYKFARVRSSHRAMTS